MIEHGRLLWPDDDEEAHRVMPRYLAAALPEVLNHVRDRRCALQAGGNVGLYPLALAEIFDNVITVEPDVVNFACMAANVGERMNVTLSRCALGDRARHAGIVRQPDNCGASRIVDGESDVEVVRIDDLGLTECDLIWLSVNGCLAEVVRGAAATILRRKPVVVLSEPRDDDGGARRWLYDHGYRVAGRVPIRDYIMVP